MIFDVFRGHLVPEIDEILEENKLLKVLVPSNCTDRLQPLDLSANKALKTLEQTFGSGMHKKCPSNYSKTRIQKLSRLICAFLS